MYLYLNNTVINMPFFSRPNLDDSNFIQKPDNTITLSGNTIINSYSGITLSDEFGIKIPIIITGTSNNKVLTFKNDKIVLDNTSSFETVYNGGSPTTCSVGGLVAGSNIFGCSISSILNDILVPTLYPILTNPSSNINISPSNNIYEVGSTISIDSNTTFDRGSITPSYGTSGYRSGNAKLYEYNIWGKTLEYKSSANTYNISISNHIISKGNNSISSRVKYNQGEQPLNSKGEYYLEPLSEGYTNSTNINIIGIYPYFYGKYSSNNGSIGSNRPLPNASLIMSGNKVIDFSNGELTINFNSNSDDYIWFAIPENSTNKTKWFVNSLNNGNIGGGVNIGGNLFPDYVLVNNVSSSLWNNQKYKLYISNYQTSINENMKLYR